MEPWEHWSQTLRQWANSLGVEDITGAEIARLVHVVAVAYQRAMRGRPEMANLSQPRFRLLLYIFFLSQGPYPHGVPFEALRRMRGITKGTLSALLQALEKEGWVQRVPDPEDGRRIRILPTAQTLEAIVARAPAHFAFFNRLASSLTQEERQNLIHLLQKLYAGLQQHLEAEAHPTASIETPTET